MARKIVKVYLTPQQKKRLRWAKPFKIPQISVAKERCFKSVAASSMVLSFESTQYMCSTSWFKLADETPRVFA
jgi:hypothetical protein